MAGPNWKLEDDFETVTLTLPTDPPVALRLSTSDVDNILKNLGDFRGTMKPAISTQSPLGQKVLAIPDPQWASEPDVMLGQSLFHLRDPRFGWLHYLLPKQEARNLAEFLLKQADLVDPVPIRDQTH